MAKVRTTHKLKAVPAADPRRHYGRASWLFIALAAIAMYASALDLPFLGDDFVFLDKTRSSRFAELWSLSNTNFDWYRPWSREFFFWALQHLAGANALVFRAFNLLLWIASLLLLGRLFSRLSDRRTAVAIVAGTEALGLWGAPLIWISGSQDVWLVFFLSLTLLAGISPRRQLALLPYALGLLSKETAVAFPLILGGIWYFVERCRIRVLVLRLLPFAIVTIGWLLLHPTLVPRLLHPHEAAPTAEPSLPAWQVALNTLQAMLNVDQLRGEFAPSIVNWAGLMLGALLLIAAIRIARHAPPSPALEDRAHGLMWAGCVWAVAGWIPLFMPSVGWHAYYGCVGAIGACVALACWMRRDQSMWLGFVIILCVLRIPNSSTQSFEWGSEWYQRRAGDLLNQIRRQLAALHPTFPPHTRLYFTAIPNNIGFIAGDSPAVRVWYGDSTLGANFYEQYRPRLAQESAGQDLFFQYDPNGGLREVHLGPEDVARAVAGNPGWELDHEKLANTLFRRGNPHQAAEEYEKIAQLPSRADALIAAAVCRVMGGEASAADSITERAAVRLSKPIPEVAESVRVLREKVERQLLDSR